MSGSRQSGSRMYLGSRVVGQYSAAVDQTTSRLDQHSTVSHSVIYYILIYINNRSYTIRLDILNTRLYTTSILYCVLYRTLVQSNNFIYFNISCISFVLVQSSISCALVLLCQYSQVYYEQSSQSRSVNLLPRRFRLSEYTENPQ